MYPALAHRDADAPGREAFVRANTRPGAVPHVPEISLLLADDAIALWERTEDVSGRGDLPPPFWAFAWAGGQALARYVLDHPDLVRDRRVLDLASGSGLVAIAAARAGAATVTANEVDPLAVAAIALNAAANDVAVVTSFGDVLDHTVPADVVLAGDVFYSRPMAERVWPFLARARHRGARVLVGDPGRAYLPRGRLEALETYRVPVPRALEDADVKATTVWQVAPTDERASRGGAAQA